MAAPDSNKAGPISTGDLLHMRKDLARGVIIGATKAVKEVASGVADAAMAAGDQNIENAPHPLEALERGAEKLVDSFIHPAGDMNLSNAQHPADKFKEKAADKMAAMSAAGLAASTVEAGTFLGEQAVLLMPGGEEMKAVGVAKELGAIEATVVDAGKGGKVLHSDAPKASLTEMLYGRITGEAAANKPAAELSRMFDRVKASAMQRDNVFKESIDRTDNTLTHSGQTVAQSKQYNDWNREQIPKRNEYYKYLITENPELAEMLLGQDITEHGLMQLLKSDVNDRYIGIKPYNSPVDKDEVFQRTGRGSHDERMQAKQWGIEWKNGGENLGVAIFQDLFKGGEIGMNQEFYDARKAVVASEELSLEMHRELGAMLVDPARPMSPVLAEKAQQLLSVRLENGTLSAEARSALPPELQALPAVKLESLQAKVAPLVPENMRLAAGYNAPALPHASTANAAHSASAEIGKALSVSQPANMQELQSMRRDVLSPLSMIIEKKPIEASLPLTEAQLAAQANVDALAKHQNPYARATLSVGDAIMDKSGFGYSMGKTTEALIGQAVAQSEYDGMVSIANMTARKAATTMLVAGTAATVGLPAAGALVAGSILYTLARDYDLLSKVGKVAGPTIERAHYEAHALGNAVKEQGQTAYDKLAAMIPRDATGNLTPQGQVVMQQIEQNAAQQVDSAVALIPPAEIPGP